MSTSRRAWRHLLLFALAAAASVPAADAAYRLAGLRPSDNLSGLYEGLGDGGFRLRADVSTSADWYSGPFTVLTDGLGLRCGASPATRTGPGDSVDYLVLGDSQGFGQCVDYEESLAGSLAVRAAGEGRKVANASVGGHYLRNQLQVASQLRQRYHLDFDHLVVLLTPYLIAAGDGYNTVEVSAAGDLFESEPTLKSQAALWAKTHTTLFGRLRNFIHNLRGLEVDNSMLLGFFDGGPRLQQRQDGLGAALEAVTAWADSAGADVQLVYVPLAVELDFGGVASLAAAKGQAADVEVPWRIASAVAAGRDLPLLDLRPALAAVGAAGEPVTCRGDPHYSPQASVACAGTIWQRLATQPGR